MTAGRDTQESLSVSGRRAPIILESLQSNTTGRTAGIGDCQAGVVATGLVDIDARIRGGNCGGDAGLGDKNAGRAVGKDAGASGR